LELYRYFPIRFHGLDRDKFTITFTVSTWRIKNNEELDKLIKHENIVNYVKPQRLSWFGHIQKMPEAKTTNKIFKWNPLTTRPRGRPKCRWEDNIIQDLGQMKIKNWLTCVQDRAKWKDAVEKPKTFK
jgi:hypothetical protein